MYDRRDNAFADRDAWCFNTDYTDEDKTVEIQVNQEFSQEKALKLAQFYGEAIGRLPKVLRRDVQTVWIHDGLNGFGGGNNNLLIHTKQGDDYVNYWKGDILDETFIHEGSHTSIDGYVYGTPKWEAAVADDAKFISDYARDNPQREDIAETYLVWFATRARPETFTKAELDQWEADMGNRFEYFDEMCEDMSPYPDCKFCST